MWLMEMTGFLVGLLMVEVSMGSPRVAVYPWDGDSWGWVPGEGPHGGISQ